MMKGTYGDNFSMIKDAQHIKTEIIDLFLKDNDLDLIVSEFPFFKGKRLADLIFIKRDEIIAFEIKSEKDSLQNLLAQLKDYALVFNTVYAVIADKFIEAKEIKKIPSSIGIIVVPDNDPPYIKRNATKRKRIGKKYLLSLLWKKDLLALINKKTQDSMEKNREIAAKSNTVLQIQEHSIKSLKARYLQSYKMFLQDRGNYTAIEDLRTITGLKKNLSV